MHRLIGFGPSPFARKVRIALIEKKIPYTWEEQVPWDSTTTTALYNPLQKVPILLIPKNDNTAISGGQNEQNFTAIYESHYILEYLDLMYPHTKPLLHRDDINAQLLAEKIEVIADGVGTAMQLRYFELERDPEVRSEVWLARQVRKMDGGMAALQRLVLRDGEANIDPSEAAIKDYLVEDTFGLADVAVGAVCSYIGNRVPEYDMQGKFPALWRYCQNLAHRQSFRDSVPTDSLIKDKVV